MLTLYTKTSLYAEDRGIQVPMTLEYGKIGGTQFCDQLHCRSNGSINYTDRADVRLFVSLNKGRVEGHSSVLTPLLSVNKKANYYVWCLYSLHGFPDE
jgi:hypothetical protein